MNGAYIVLIVASLFGLIAAVSSIVKARKNSEKETPSENPPKKRRRLSATQMMWIQDGSLALLKTSLVFLVIHTIAFITVKNTVSNTLSQVWGWLIPSFAVALIGAYLKRDAHPQKDPETEEELDSYLEKYVYEPKKYNAISRWIHILIVIVAVITTQRTHYVKLEAEELAQIKASGGVWRTKEPVKHLWWAGWPVVDQRTGALSAEEPHLAFEAKILTFDEHVFEFIIKRKNVSGGRATTFFSWDTRQDRHYGVWHEDSPPRTGRWKLSATGPDRFEGMLTFYPARRDTIRVQTPFIRNQHPEPDNREIQIPFWLQAAAASRTNLWHPWQR